MFCSLILRPCYRIRRRCLTQRFCVAHRKRERAVRPTRPSGDVSIKTYGRHAIAQSLQRSWDHECLFHTRLRLTDLSVAHCPFVFDITVDHVPPNTYPSTQEHTDTPPSALVEHDRPIYPLGMIIALLIVLVTKTLFPTTHRSPTAHSHWTETDTTS